MRSYIKSGLLVAKKVERPARRLVAHYAWLGDATHQGKALQWWLAQLQHATTRTALLENHQVY